MHTITISPITRANTVGSVTVVVDGGRIVKAFSEGTVFRGFEKIMEGRDPWDAPYLTQRICGICSSAHGLAAARALEAIAGVEPPPNAILTRNLITGLDFLQNHLRHFYILHMWDWVSPPPEYPFKGGYNRDFRFSTRITKRFREHYWLGADAARLAHETLTLLGGKTPHNHGIIPGGVSLVPRGEVLAELRPRVKKLKSFVNDFYLPDALLLEETYPDYLDLGSAGPGFLSFGLFQKPGGAADYYFPPGVMLAGRVEPVNLAEIEESEASSWFRGEGGFPFENTTVPDPARVKAYSWIKAPRYRGSTCQGGPLARAAIGKRDPSGGDSVMQRIRARADEAQRIAGLLEGWLEELSPGEASSTELRLPSTGSGVGTTEAMRGPLSHWVTLKRGRLANYQIITPSAWNFSSQDEREQPGPVEKALLDTPVADAEEPVEIGRIIRSFDPCYACAAHVLDLGKGTNTTVRLL